ncbi:DUF397 domain-containing protein [Actinomadura montaniterrae]|uniref:DUF397 domain-containing protein n=1 Tax=Actinomadura montaniterrae TaxID=1803903 RepID=A0A6L3VLJ8_9ACTN|nr:DUF397 domain-containing protein [Actinomadura montaniterrae]KAB2367178.1 DUF397 domain-containing protein [Actinomadura montaniterrae]
MKAQWQKSSYSNGTHEGSNCVELAALAMGVGVRDSKDRDGGHVTLDRASFAALLARIRSGTLDLP